MDRGVDWKKNYANSLRWRQEGLSDRDGIVVGADITQEWILPWWWERYRKHNSYPVLFVDFGMSQEMKKWCEDRGERIRLLVPDIFVTEKQDMHPELVKKYEAFFTQCIWSARNAWFKKPLACLQSPFRRAIWIDIDCEIRGALDGAFNLFEKSTTIMLSQETLQMYNSGVIVFSHGNSLIEEWGSGVFDHKHELPGDQEILTKIIREKNISVMHLPEIYNWSRYNKENSSAIIVHWHGQHGKTVIAHQIMCDSSSSPKA